VRRRDFIALFGGAATVWPFGAGAHRPYDAFEVLYSQVLKLKQAPHELPSALRNDHPVRLCNALQASRKVRCLAYDGLKREG
jgi:hypothetical protein